MTVDEEFTHVGSSRLAAVRPSVDLAIVAEPTNLDLVTSHKGAIRWKVRAGGVACHSSTPDLGDNAIYRMAKVVSALHHHAGELARSTPDPVLGPPSLSIGRIEGGQSVNVVPDWCEIEIDRRVIPGEDPDGAMGLAAEALLGRFGSLDHLEFLPAWVKMPALSANMRAEDLDVMTRVITDLTGRVPLRRGCPTVRTLVRWGRSASPAWCSVPATSRRLIRRTNGSTSTRCAWRRNCIIGWRSPWGDNAIAQRSFGGVL